MDSKDREEQGRWRKGVERKLAALEVGQNRLVGDVETLKSDVETLKGDVETLKGDVETLKGDVETLKGDVGELKTGQRRLIEDVETLKSDVGELKDGQKRTDDVLAFIIKTIDRYQAENRRHLEVLIEHQKSDRAGQGEGIRANRERLEDHELRIRNLEAS